MTHTPVTAHEGALGGSYQSASVPLRPPPSARRLAIDQSWRRKCGQKPCDWGTLTAGDARSGEWTSQGGKVLRSQGPFLLKTDSGNAQRFEELRRCRIHQRGNLPLRTRIATAATAFLSP